jgi:pimeloyl-ACP methyl ester carboxylesterase
VGFFWYRGSDFLPIEGPNQCVRRRRTTFCNMTIDLHDITVNSATYQVRRWGSGPPVVMYPSLGRSGSDFDQLGEELAEEGFSALAITPPGIGTPLGTPQWENLFSLASDVWTIVDQLGLKGVTLVGHAFGNRVVRAASTMRPLDVATLVLLACGGDVHADPEIGDDFLSCFDATMNEEEHSGAVRRAFFAPGNDIGAWREGWHGELAQLQGTAVRATLFEDFALGGTAPGLIVQGLNDRIAPPQNAWNLVKRRPNTRVVGLAHCGHAILPEQPRAVRDALVSFLREFLEN